MKPPSSVQMVVHSRVMGLTQRMNDYPMSGKSVGLEEDIHVYVFVCCIEILYLMF